MSIWHYLCFRYHLGLYSMQAPSYLGKLILVSTWFQNGIQIFSHLDIPHQTSILLISLTILIPTGLFIDTIVDVVDYYWHNAFTDISHQHSHAHITLSNIYQPSTPTIFKHNVSSETHSVLRLNFLTNKHP